MQAKLDTFGQLRAVDLSASTLPVAFFGRLEESPRERERLAIALNGTVADVTRSYGQDGEVVFSALVPPETLRSRSNSVAVLSIRDGFTGRVLVPLRTLQQKTFELVERDGRKVIQTPAGEQIEVEPGAAKGFVGFQQEEGSAGLLTATGWALTSGDVPVDKLLFFEDDRFLASATPSTERPDIAKEFGLEALKSGFSLPAPPAGIYGRGLHLFAVAGNRASELPREPSAADEGAPR